MKTIRSSLLTLIAGLIIFQSSEAMATYFFNVKVKNNKSFTLRNTKSRVNAGLFGVTQYLRIT